MQTGIWFPTVKTRTGTDVFTEQLASRLETIGFKVAIDWLPLRAEYAPWTVRVPKPPSWAHVAHVNSWLATRFLPPNLNIVATIHHSIHDPRLRQYKGFIRTLYHRYWITRMEGANLRRATVFVAVSRDAARQAEQTFSCKPIRVIPNGIDVGSRVFQIRAAPNSPFRMIYVGTWMARKGVDLLGSILGQLGARYELFCIGGIPSSQERAALPNNIRFLGRILDRQQLMTMFEGADAFLFPSRSEGLSLSLVEAQACGLPAIVAACSSMPEVVVGGHTGVLCPVDDASAFAKAAERLSNHHEYWRAMRAAAHLRATTRFSLERQVSEYASLYRSLSGSL